MCVDDGELGWELCSGMLPLCHINSLTSYRSELEGIYHGLRHIQHLKLMPTTIHQWCDSKSAVDNSNRDQRHHTHLDSLWMDNSLHWFLDHRTSLARHDQYLLNNSQSDVDHMPPQTKRKLVRLLEMAQKIHCQEMKTRESGQAVLTDSYPSVNPRA